MSGESFSAQPPDDAIYAYKDDLRGTLGWFCYQSLVECDHQRMIADGRLTDILRRLDAFWTDVADIGYPARKRTGILRPLIRFTRHLGLGELSGLGNENRRLDFLTEELQQQTAP